MSGEAVLIADDDRGIRETMRAILERAGHYTVFEASDGDQALAVLNQEQVDVILLDLAMPGRDGLGVLAEIQPPPPIVVVVSAFEYFSLDDVARQTQEKVFRYLRKPVPPQELLDSISSALSTSN